MIEARFEAEGHRYWHPETGAELPSVTTILRAMGLIDTAWCTESARARGSAVHLACQYLDEGGVNWSKLGAYEGYVRAWEKFRTDHEMKFVLIERPLIHPVYGYAGMPDRLALMQNGEEWLIDLKTGPVLPWTVLQLGGYDGMIGGDRIRRYLGLQLKKDGSYKPKFFDAPRAKEQFYSELSGYFWRLSNGYKLD